MCATLSIPIPAARTQVDRLVEMDDNTVEKQRRLATLLGLTAPPTRTSLVKDLVSHGNAEMQISGFLARISKKNYYFLIEL